MKLQISTDDKRYKKHIDYFTHTSLQNKIVCDITSNMMSLFCK